MAAGSQRLDAARRLTNPRRTRSSATESPVGWTSCAGRPGTGDIAETYEHLRCRGTGRCDELTARRCAGSPSGRKDRQSWPPQRNPENGTAPNSDPFLEPDQESEGILGVTAMRATRGPRLAARRGTLAGD